MSQQEQVVTEKRQTIGEYRVGITFNPGGHPAVESIKRIAADAIDKVEHDKNEYLTSLPIDEKPDAEVMRLFALAQTSFEEAAMWGVKAVTKPARK